MHCPLRTFWRRQARGQEVPSAATARMVVRQMVGRYAASATDQRSPRLSGRPEFADQTAAKRKWDVRVQQPGPTAGSWSEPWCGLNSSTSQQMDDAGDGGTHINDQKDPSEPKRKRGELFWDAAEQNAEADNREGAGVNLGALTLFLLDKEAKLSCLLLQRPLELDPHPGPDQ